MWVGRPGDQGDHRPSIRVGQWAGRIRCPVRRGRACAHLTRPPRGRPGLPRTPGARVDRSV